MRRIVSVEGRHHGCSDETRLPRDMRARVAPGTGLLRLSDREGRARYPGPHRVDALPAAQAPREGRVPDRLLRGAQRATAKVLPTHADRRGAHRRISIRAGGHHQCRTCNYPKFFHDLP